MSKFKTQYIDISSIEYDEKTMNDSVCIQIRETNEQRLISYEQIKRKIITDFADYLFKKCDVYVNKSDVEKYLKNE